MARAKTTPEPTEVKAITKEQLNILSQIKDALDNATDEIKDLGDNGEQDQMTIGFTLGKLHKSLMDAYNQIDNLYDELDIDNENTDENEW
jgi:hypothetical protein